MIRKSRDVPTPGRRRRGRKAAPLDVYVTLRFNFGESPREAVTVMDGKRIPMVDSVFKSRDRILSAFFTLLVKTGLAQPKVAKEILPVLRLLRRRR